MRATKLVLVGAILAAATSCQVPDKYFEVDADTGVMLTITRSGNSDGTVVSVPGGIDCGTTCSVTVPRDTMLTLTATPGADTDFTGWTGGGCAGTAPCQVTLTADTTIDAAFDLMTFTVDVGRTGNGTGTVTSAPAGIDCGLDCSEDFDHGTQVTLTAVADAASSFLGWTGGGCTGTGPCVVDVTDDTQVMAAFALNNSVVVTKDGTGMGTVTSVPGGITCGPDCDEAYAPNTTVTLTAAPIGDATFTGWSGGCTGTTNPCVLTVTSAVLVTATFTQRQYPLTVTRNGTGAGTVTSAPAGINCGATCAAPFDSGTSVVLTAAPTLGKFAGWSGGGCTGIDTCTVSITAATNVTATFTQIVVTDVTSPTSNGAYGVGAGIVIHVVFTDPVVVTGTPTLALNAGTSAAYAAGSGTNTLVFAYTVGSGQSSADLDYVNANALALAGGTIRDALGNAATLTLPAPGAFGSLGFNKAIVIDAVAPTVTNVTSSTANGAYAAGAVISIQVAFTEAVTVVGTPTLALGTGATATYSGGSATSVLSFAYTVGAGQNAADLDYAATSSLSTAGGTIRDATLNNAVLTLPAPGAAGSLGFNKALVIDTVAPTVTNVTSSTANGAYGAGAAISIQVTFSEAVTVAGGVPQLALNTGGTATYTSGTGTATLTFAHTVGAGQNTADLDYAAVGSLTLNGSTVRDAATNAAVLALAAPGSPASLAGNKAIVVDTLAPTVTNVTSSTTNGTYGVGGVISIQVNFSESVNVAGGTPQLALNTGATATYASGTGTASLTFTYTVGAGQNTGDLDYAATGSLTLNGANVRDGATNNAVLTLPATGGPSSLAGAQALVIDTTSSTVSSVNSTTSNGSYGVNGVISIQVLFNEIVVVTGTPRLALNSGATVNYTSGSGTTTLTFNYTVAAGQNTGDLDEASTTALSLSGGTIRDAVANNATLTLPAPGAVNSLGANKALVIDTAGPIITNVTSPTNNGTYGAGSVITIQVAWNEAATVTGTPRLALNAAPTPPLATFSGGSGTPTLTFSYTVAAGHNSGDLDYTTINALTIVGGTIRDALANDATVTLPPPFGAGSLAANKAIVVDTGALWACTFQEAEHPAYTPPARDIALCGNNYTPATIASACRTGWHVCRVSEWIARFPAGVAPFGTQTTWGASQAARCTGGVWQAAQPMNATPWGSGVCNDPYNPWNSGKYLFADDGVTLLQGSGSCCGWDSTFGAPVATSNLAVYCCR